jgi:putative chitinase
MRFEMSIEIVASKMGASPEHALRLEETARQFDISSVLEKAHWLGQIYVESGGFRRTKENLNYSAKRLAEVWPYRYAANPTARMADRLPNALAKEIGGKPDKIAELTYGGRLGNIHAGDGWTFIGRGDKQLTGRYNYTMYSRSIYGDDRIVDDPARLQRPPDSTLSAGWYWQWKKCGEPANRDDAEAVTLLVNGGTNGLFDRVKQTNRAKALFAELLR